MRELRSRTGDGFSATDGPAKKPKAIDNRGQPNKLQHGHNIEIAVGLRRDLGETIRGHVYSSADDLLSELHSQAGIDVPANLRVEERRH
ncbi:hypothetical protein GCM10007857_43030 [Bradyrhizobium iriomotense]|uniref:Uncharacterized protein n=1 Tax=Bradyrhizobium iriomotense TaxID=441950 RepID=A0ABQ6AZG6_9BRAD|nr:hypothetical protein GCM10007857_43030 [Bradyrhizobium iriomotense]